MRGGPGLRPFFVAAGTTAVLGCAVAFVACAPDALRYGGGPAAGTSGAAGGAGAAGGGGAAGGEPVFVSGPLPPARSCAGDLRCADGLSCCASVDVPGGDVLYGKSLDGPDAFPISDNIGAHELPEQRSTVSAFTLDTFEVTVGRFRNWVDAYDGRPPPEGAGAHPRIADTGWKSDWNARLPGSREELRKRVSCDPIAGPWTDESGANEQKPITCTNWYEAMAFCIWDGGRLPTSREWELAASGGEENRLYPWGAAPPTRELTNFGCAGDDVPGCSPGDIFLVGAQPMGNGRYGHRDLAGGVTEWVFDGGYSTEACVDCVVHPTTDVRLLRGGSWAGWELALRSVFRDAPRPETRSETSGFRCVRPPNKRSCASGPRCGIGADTGGGADCCETITLPGGTFALGRSDEGADACPGSGCLSNELPERQATVSPFALDTYEVTVQRFLPFVEAYPASLPREGEGAHPRIPGSGWQKAWELDHRCTVNNVDYERCRFGIPPTRDGLDGHLTGVFSTVTTDPARTGAPMNTMNWYLAFAFCVWDGGRLPTEAEWEFAAAGGDENRLYPWGAEPPTTDRAAFGCLFSGAEDCHIADLARPGRLPKGRARWGHHDMAGNVGEWVLDAYALYPETPCVDCANVVSSDARIARGGMFRQKALDLRATRRVFLTAQQGDSGVGIRCARDL